MLTAQSIETEDIYNKNENLNNHIFELQKYLNFFNKMFKQTVFDVVFVLLLPYIFDTDKLF